MSVLFPEVVPPPASSRLVVLVSRGDPPFATFFYKSFWCLILNLLVLAKWLCSVYGSAFGSEDNNDPDKLHL